MSDPGTTRLVLTRDAPALPWVGQMVRIDVALYRPYPDSGELPPFSLDELDVPGAIALLRPEAPPPSELDEAGVTMLVQHRTLLVFAQEDGTITLPPLRAHFDDPTTHAPVRVESEPLRFEASLPHVANDAELPVVARGLSLKSELDRSLAGLAVGDAFTRSVVISADDTDPIMLPEVQFAQASGLRVYAAEPRALGSAERGQIHASRSFSATYVVERVGHYELPALRVRWLDPGTGRYATAEAASLSFWARPSFGLGLNAFGSAPGLGAALLLSATLLLATLGYLVRRRWREGPFAWERRLAARFREQRAFLAFERALRHSAPLTLLGRAYRWLALCLPNEPRTLAKLRGASSPSSEALRAWEEQAFAGRANGANGRGLHRVFVRARRKLVKPGDAAALHDINPHHEPREESSWTTPSG